MYAKKKKDAIILKPKFDMDDEFKIRFNSQNEAEYFMQDIIDAKTNKSTKRFERHNCMVRQHGNELIIKFIETNRNDKVCCIIKFSKDEVGKDKSSLINIVFDKLAHELTDTFADAIKDFVKDEENEEAVDEKQQEAVKQKTDKKLEETEAEKVKEFDIDPNQPMTREERRQLRRKAEREKEREKEREFQEEMEQFIKDDPLQDAIDWIDEKNKADKNRNNTTNFGL